MLTLRYLTLMLTFMALSLIAIRWARAGGALYGLFGIGFAVWIVMTRRVLNVAVILSWMPVTLPVVVLGILFWCGRPRPLRLAYALSVLVPTAVAAACALEPITRIVGRIDDHNRGARTVQGNGVTLTWAPQGPGWPAPDPGDKAWVTRWRGPTWEEARQACRHLAHDGASLLSTPQDIWRLPTVAEVVRSMARHGTNSGGVWFEAQARASYTVTPDKEPPLWDPHSPIIYWWTSSEHGKTAYAVDFNGRVYVRDKASTLGSQGFRAVRDPDAQ